MNRKNKTYAPFFIALASMLLFAVGIGCVYKSARNRPPLKYGNITDETISWLLKQTGVDPDIANLFSDIPLALDQWDNASDIGAQDSTGWMNLEDANFIVYYKEDPEQIWQKNAEMTLKIANRSIPELEACMGKYYYPSDMNGRKLCIYLATSTLEYESVVAQLAPKMPKKDMESSAGIHLGCVSPSGYLSYGIVLKPVNFEPGTDLSNSVFSTLPHQMCHYVYSSAVDYGKNIQPYNWVREGLAQYMGSQRAAQVSGTDSINYIASSCQLNADFPTTERHNVEGWAGASFYRYISSAYGKDVLKNFVINTYSTSVDSALIMSLPNVSDVHADWVNHLNGVQTVTAHDSIN